MYGRLIPAAHVAAIVAGVAHVASLGIITGSLELEAIGIVFLTYIVTFSAAVPFGIVLLTIIGLFKIGLWQSLALFLVSAPLAVISISTFFFGFEPTTIPLQYALVAFPSVLAAWYFSVYREWKANRINTV